MEGQTKSGFCIIAYRMYHNDGMYSCGTSHIYINVHGVNALLIVG